MRKFKKTITDPDSLRQKTFDQAVSLLAFKQHSVAELRARLLEKVWTNEEIVENVIEKLKEYNYLNDEQFAAAYAASKLRHKAIGKRRLAQVLIRRKLDRETVENTLESIYEETSEKSIIDRAIEKRQRIKGTPKTHNEKQNFFGYLVRLGFEYDLIREKMFELFKPESE